jgi:hypothetical protein
MNVANLILTRKCALIAVFSLGGLVVSYHYALPSPSHIFLT